MALNVLFYKDLFVNVENYPVRTFTLFPKAEAIDPAAGRIKLITGAY